MLTVLVTLVVTGVIGATLVLTGVYDRALELIRGDAEQTDDPATVPVEERQLSAILVTYDEQTASAEASRVLVLAADRQTGEGTVLLVPTATVVDVPGRGSFELGEAQTLGGGQLVGTSLENLLGARFDGTLEVPIQGWASLLERAGGFTVDVRSRLVQREEDGGQVRFEPGQQFLDGPRLAEYLAFEADNETQLEALLRVQQVVNGLLDVVAAEPESLDRMFADDTVLEGGDQQLLRDLLEELADARLGDQLTVLTLPVSPLAGGEDVYQADTERMERLVDEHFAGSRPDDAVGAGRALQILNGNAEPGIGQVVAEQLRDGGYRVVLTGNADNFDHETTRIIVYEETAEQVAIAQDIQTRLGVGEIVRSEVPQSVVDITIIVGHDFLDE